MEMMKNAWLGWQNYTNHGKAAALFLLALLYLWRTWGKRTAGIKRLTAYAAAAGTLCIFPLTAAILMYYQTRFYNYEWIWSLVPVTAVIALAGTLFIAEQLKGWSGIKNIGYNILLVAMLLGMVILCGRLGEDDWGRKAESENRKNAERVLAEIIKEDAGDEICLWAPQEISEYVRAYDGRVKLLYGRNMWDAALDAYSYDTYPDRMKEMYRWIEELYIDKEWADALDKQLADAQKFGVNRILLSGRIRGEALEALEKYAEANGFEMLRIEDYYLLKMG